MKNTQMAPCLSESIHFGILQTMKYKDAKAFLQSLKHDYYMNDLLEWIEYEAGKSEARQAEILTDIATHETDITIISYCTEFFSASDGIILWCRGLIEQDFTGWLFKHVVSQNIELVNKFFIDAIKHSPIGIVKFVYNAVPEKIKDTTVETAITHKRRDIIEWLFEFAR